MVVVIITVIISSRGQAFVPTAVLNVKTCFPSTNSGPLTAAVIISGYDEAYTCRTASIPSEGSGSGSTSLLNNGTPFPFVESAYAPFFLYIDYWWNQRISTQNVARSYS